LKMKGCQWYNHNGDEVHRETSGAQGLRLMTSTGRQTR
jgi:hypothetical protein